MASDHPESIRLIAQSWRTASKRLHIRVSAPHQVTRGKETLSCAAFLPDFGGPHGMVIGITQPPSFEVDRQLIEFAHSSGVYYTFVNPNLYRKFDETVFMEALRDWGFFGSQERKPPWIL